MVSSLIFPSNSFNHFCLVLDLRLVLSCFGQWAEFWKQSIAGASLQLHSAKSSATASCDSTYKLPRLSAAHTAWCCMQRLKGWKPRRKQWDHLNGCEKAVFFSILMWSALCCSSSLTMEVPDIRIQPSVRTVKDWKLQWVWSIQRSNEE